MKHANVSPLLAKVIHSKLATMYELQTVYGTQDLYDFLEMIHIHYVNESIAYED